MLSRELRQRRHDDISMLGHSNIGYELIWAAEHLEAGHEALRDGVQEIRNVAGTAWAQTSMTHPLSNMLHTIIKSCDALLTEESETLVRRSNSAMTRAVKAEAELTLLKAYVEEFHDEDYVLWKREEDEKNSG